MSLRVPPILTITSDWHSVSTILGRARCVALIRMKLLDLDTLRQQSRQRLRLLFGTLIFVAAWTTVFFVYSDVILNRLGLRAVLIGNAVPIIALLVLALNTIGGAPKCPHCGVRLVGSLFNIAIASGNCGRCGRRIVD